MGKLIDANIIIVNQTIDPVEMDNLIYSLRSTLGKIGLVQIDNFLLNDYLKEYLNTLNYLSEELDLPIVIKSKPESPSVLKNAKVELLNIRNYNKN